MPTNDYHEGRPIVETSRDGKRVLVLCPYRHLVTATDMRDWAGSYLEAKSSDRTWTVRCFGTLPRRLPHP